MTGIIFPKRLTRKTSRSWFVPAMLERKLYRFGSVSVTGFLSSSGLLKEKLGDKKGIIFRRVRSELFRPLILEARLGRQVHYYILDFFLAFFLATPVSPGGPI